MDRGLPKCCEGARQKDLEFRVVLDKTTGRKIGAKLKFRGDAVEDAEEILEVTGDLIQQWNEDHPELAVKRGDRIAEVNGVKEWWTQDKILELVVRRKIQVKKPDAAPKAKGKAEPAPLAAEPKVKGKAKAAPKAAAEPAPTAPTAAAETKAKANAKTKVHADVDWDVDQPDQAAKRGALQMDDLTRGEAPHLRDTDPERALQPQTDEVYAQRLQYQEEQMIRQHLAQNMGARMWEAAHFTSDPVWGHLEFGIIAYNESWSKRTREQIKLSLLFNSCPCCMFTAAWCFRDRMLIRQGATHRDIRTGYRRMLLSWSFLLAVFQLMLVIFQEVVGYTWGAEEGVDVSGDYQHPTRGHQYDAEGAKNAAKIIYRNEWWRLVTPIFLHAGWLHLLSNLGVQLRTGMMLEVIWGRHVWLLIYVSSGILGNVWSCIAKPDLLSLGASSSLCGILGAWPVFVAITWNQTTPNDRKKRDREMMFVILAIVVMVAFSFLPMVDWATHFGGLAAGMTVSATCFARKLQTPSWSIATGVIGALSSASLFVGSMAYMFVCVKPDERLLEL